MCMLRMQINVEMSENVHWVLNPMKKHSQNIFLLSFFVHNNEDEIKYGVILYFKVCYSVIRHLGTE